MTHEEVARLWEANAQAWTALSRQGYDRSRDLFNTPTFLRILPSVEGLRGLDIGCGEGHNTRLLARRKARMTGIDLAPTFIRHASESEAADSLGIRYSIASAVALPFADHSYDFATSFMCFQDVCDQAGAMAEAFRVLQPGGFLQFSITHPCFQTSKWGRIRDEQGRKVSLTVGDYFAQEGRCDIDEWIFGAAPDSVKAAYPKFKIAYFRRTLSSWLNLVLRTGFTIEEVAEPTPDDTTLREYPAEYDARLIAYFLILRCRKPIC